VQLLSLEAKDFRNIVGTFVEPDPEGTTVLSGLNGAGKTSVLEAVCYLSTLRSFRRASRDVMVRRGAECAIVRAVIGAEHRTITIEAEITAAGRARTLVNRQPVRRRADLHDALRTTLFSPEDIGVVRGGPAERRQFLDDAVGVLDVQAARAVDDVEKIVRQRTALLRAAGRRLGADELTTLDVWDTRLDEMGTALVELREGLVADLSPLAEEHYSRLAGTEVVVGLEYRRSWEGRLLDALRRARSDDLARGASSVGPHRDELELSVDGLPARTHASQGEQRSLALALRLGAHQLATSRLGSAPVLLLDDVFSELDPHRSNALLAGLPPGQALLTTALAGAPDMPSARLYRLEAGGNIVLVPQKEEPE
jgi:DNA replication and repair protein RecF